MGVDKKIMYVIDKFNYLFRFNRNLKRVFK